MVVDLNNKMTTLIGDYIVDPVVEASSGSVFETAYKTVGSVLDTEVYRAAGDELSAGRPVTIGSLAKDFAGGFLNIGQGRGGSGIYSNKPIPLPPPPKVNAPASKVTSGLGPFRPTNVDLERDFGLTKGVKANLYKASVSDVANIQQFFSKALASSQRRTGTKIKLGSSSMPKVATKTTMPYQRKPRYFGL